MYSGKANSIEAFRFAEQFERLCHRLATQEFETHRRHTLAHWALPTDRRLPLAFMGRRLNDVLSADFNELANTPGIGEKKLRTLIVLLERAATTPSEALPRPICEQQDAASPDISPETEQEPREPVDADSVNELSWRRWQMAVVQHELSEATFGQFAPSLRDMTRSLWTTPLGQYTELSLTELREKKSHGEKRVRAILNVFGHLYGIVRAMHPPEHLAVRIMPRRIDAVEQWVGEIMQTPGLPSREAIEAGLIMPLIEQIRVDAVDTVIQLAERRLGLKGEIPSVRQLARDAALTRARVYQLLNDVNDIMTVRWPRGRHQVYELRDKFQRESHRQDESAGASQANGEATDLRQFHAAIELFYPGSRRGAADHVEKADAACIAESPDESNVVERSAS